MAKLDQRYASFKKEASEDIADIQEYMGLIEEEVGKLQSDLKNRKFDISIFRSIKAGEERQFIKYSILQLGTYKGSVVVQWNNKIISEYVTNNVDALETALEIEGNAAYEIGDEDHEFVPIPQDHVAPEISDACWLDVGQTLSNGGYPPNYVELYISQKNNILKTFNDLMAFFKKIDDIYNHVKSKIENFTLEEHQIYVASEKNNKYKSDKHAVEHFPDWEFRIICDHIKYAPSNYMFYVHHASMTASYLCHKCYKKS